ncbi:MAG: alpha/beta fold hydrolase [Verrucomicrobiota bacterium]
MKLLLALHGNPGAPSDFDLLRSALGLPSEAQREAEVGPARCGGRGRGSASALPSRATDEGASLCFAAFRRPVGGASVADLIEHMGGEVRRLNPARLVLMGFSWGAYLACRFAERSPVKPDSLILLNPMLAVSSPVSPLMAALLNTPVLNALLAAALARVLPGGFVARVFAPESPEPSLRDQLVKQLSSPTLWLGALRYKLEQQRHPLGAVQAARCRRAVVLRGAADAVAPWEQQAGLLKDLGPSLTVHTVEGAGHSLLWTHQDEVCAILGREIEEALR